MRFGRIDVKTKDDRFYWPEGGKEPREILEFCAMKERNGKDEN